MTSTDAYGAITARYYDAAYTWRRERSQDVDFYVNLARESAGPVLELGCGTGRVLLEALANGVPMVGVDPSASMLTVLRAKLPDHGATVVQASMHDFDLVPEKFALIFGAFRTFQHLATVDEQLRALANVRRHLRPGGVLAFDVFNPRLERAAVDEEPESEDFRFREGGDEIVRHVRVERQRATQLQHVFMRYERWRAGQKVSDDMVDFHMRWFYRYELEHLLYRAGFESVTIFGGFAREPVANDTQDLVVVAS